MKNSPAPIGFQRLKYENLIMLAPQNSAKFSHFSRNVWLFLKYFEARSKSKKRWDVETPDTWSFFRIFGIFVYFYILAKEKLLLSLSNKKTLNITRIICTFFIFIEDIWKLRGLGGVSTFHLKASYVRNKLKCPIPAPTNLKWYSPESTRITMESIKIKYKPYIYIIENHL